MVAGNANIGSRIKINAERSSYLRQNFGLDDKSKVSLNPDVIYRFQYGTGSGRKSHGICGSHHVTHPFTEQMEKVAAVKTDSMHELLDGSDPEKIGNLTYNDKFNIMVNCNYYAKGQCKSTNQIQLHQDQRFGPTGKIISKQNTQKENTATVVISIGDTRKLHM